MIAAVDSVTAASSPLMSSGATNVTPGTNGPNGSRYAGLAVTDSAPSERAAKPCCSATYCVRCFTPFEYQNRRANFRHASTASVPLLQKNVRCNPESADNFAASLPCSG